MVMYYEAKDLLLVNEHLTEDYYNETNKIKAEINGNNYCKVTLNCTIRPFVQKVADKVHAHEITGMLMELPPTEIKRLLSNFDLFIIRVN